jgi:DNA-binding CsgD family transcriptional regulator
VLDFISSAYRFCESVGSISRPHDILPVVDSISKQRRLRLFAIWIVPQHPEDFAAWKLDETLFCNPQYEYLATAAQRANWQDTAVSLTRRYGSPLAVYGRSRDFPITLTEAMRDLRLSGKHDWAFPLLRRYGARDGLYCPSRNWQCFFASSKVLKAPEVGPVTRAILHLVSGAACDRIGQLAKRPADCKIKLSARELEVLRLSSHGKSNRKIAEELHISPETVKTHTKRIMRKLEAKNFGHALLNAVRQRLID